jgi:hypothetical protein
MRKLAITMGAAAFILGAWAWTPAQADPREPGVRAWQLLQFGNNRELYAAGCLEWVFQQQIWYNRCAWQYRRGTVVTAKY